MKPPLEPLRFERHFVATVWGGRALERCLGFDLPPGHVGETWELVDREHENSIVAVGEFAGATLHELMQERGDEILGAAEPNAEGRFPLLVKYIDASQNLSVQVHPDEEAAARIGGGAEAKTEAWVVLSAEGPLYAGLAEGVTRERFERSAPTEDVVSALARHDVSRGDTVLVRGGTVHAIGAGVTLLEVQQNSTTTYRLYDWDRVGEDGKPRETHLENALACVHLEADAHPRSPEWSWPSSILGRAPLVDCHVFRMEGLHLAGPERFEPAPGFRILAATRGRGRIVHAGEASTVREGDVWLLPAALDAVTVEPSNELELVLTTPPL